MTSSSFAANGSSPMPRRGRTTEPRPAGRAGYRLKPRWQKRNRARFYDPSIGRFTSEDPIGLNGGPNLFAYTQNHPTQYRDPSGKKIHVCCRPLAFVGWAGLKHCFVRLSDASGSGDVTNIGVAVPHLVDSLTWGTIGYKAINEPHDNPWGPGNADCAESPDCPETRDCIWKIFGWWPPRFMYDPYFGPNSNTMASSISSACNLKTPSSARPGVFPFTPTPGWGGDFPRWP